MAHQHSLSHSVETSTLSDVLERVLDKGIVIAGDIRVKLVDIELLSIQIRLVICSVDKAKEMGMDWWVNNPIFRREEDRDTLASSLASIEERMARLEASLPKAETRSGQLVIPSRNVPVP
ncbi:MAG: gas vesicle protein [Acidobacteriia bacterium]|nr:gas vesicle protein [Terriglobia bacterium]